ncbi:MAG TPA: hypothetical protein VMV51_12150 [Gemmatimonadaceae bacterium]|nr:hypothetical protein [Gemmatimonadaceae bacterium]
MPNTPARSLDTRAPAGRGFPRAFVGLAVVIYAIEIAAARSAAALTHPVVPLAVTFDLVVFVPALYWLLVIRPAGASATRVVAAFMLSLLGARFVLRPDQREYLLYARFLVAPFELALVAYVVVKVRRAARGYRDAGIAADVPERIAAALANAFPYRVVGQIFTTEMALGYYALLSWRHPPHVPAGTDAFTFHRKSGLIGLYSAVIGASVVELFVVHLMVRAFHPRVAWAISAVSALGVLWLLGFTRAIVMRPVLVTAHGAVVRSGVQWMLDVPFATIDRVETGRVPTPARRAPEYLRIGGSGRANALMHLREPVVAVGAYGRARPVRTVSLTLDDAPAFAQALRARGGVDA